MTKALTALDGMEKVEVNLKKKTATVQTEISNETIIKAIEEAGYTVKKIS